MTTNTRLIAARAITQVLAHGHSLTATLDNLSQSKLSSLTLSAQDHAFVQALCYGVCRYYHRLDFILNQLLDKPLKDLELKALALVGLYQLKFMRVKPHAAVSETVYAVRKKPWAKALINALLRNYLRQQQTLEQKADNHQTAAFSHPNWLVERIQHDWPEQAETILAENNRQPPMTIRVNTAKTTLQDYLAQLTELTIPASRVEHCPSALTLDKSVNVEQLPGFSLGFASVQDSAAQIAAELLTVNSGHRVLDVCAAPGGKTSHILELQPQLSELVAIDIDAARMQRVEANLKRLNLSASARLIVGDALTPADWWDNQLFDRILLDAPCSALGVIRRHPDIKLLRSEQDITHLVALQQKLLNTVWPMLAPGGILLYATCSILKQENEQQIQTFLAQHTDAQECPFEAAWGTATTVGRQILTGDCAMDGFYYARLRKL
ncbi:16S rRNA (cytosine(967)-C(5))-methyltransferase RsmB [Methylocucumis oryzae]|uniref:16S rRNA (cytosine(967)-C(5))-methyltransferase n=1 Tax=Methylocucumis oryzae TaxID=1632867 RepID=A0A0F3IJQ7_9GAMM|nr:16S rRNA (cytosine(967)-C(5))-methyltransferase RsmB [Methylocucumis oryzae]KJV07005.1 16S rRNA methyltransferase [Methylocucumis oryzae]